jgi:rhamnosyltransferase
VNISNLNNSCVDVSAILVTYNPNLDELRSSIVAVADQVSNVFIIDNCSANFSRNWLDIFGNKFVAKIHLHSLSDNLGIGAAHNVGIQQAQIIGSTFVLLLDQDSQVAPNMVVVLRAAYDSLLRKGIEVAALGPQYRDADNGALSQFVRVGFLGFNRISGDTANSVVEADFLVSSGSLITLSAIKTVGMMDESLFIDHVDTDWCFRAKYLGFRIFGVCDALMTHSLGEQRQEFWFMRRRTAHFHKPFRYYYMIRNSILLYRRAYMPWNWRLADIVRCLKIFIFFGFIAPHSLNSLKMIWQGFTDGLKGISGKRKEL